MNKEILFEDIKCGNLSAFEAISAVLSLYVCDCRKIGR